MYYRTLRRYKATMRNKAHPEGSIAEAYTLRECLAFCKNYLNGVEMTLHIKERYNDEEEESTATLSVFSHKVRPIGGVKYVNLPYLDHELAHWYVLNNCEEIQPYIR
jgi:hypothetical protein